MDSLHSSESFDGGRAASSLLLGAVAATAGAIVWAAVAYFTGYEVGYVAWALGGLVGLTVVRFGGRGTTCAAVAGVLTVAGIAGGKLVGTRFVVEKEFEEACAAIYTPELHQELVRDAADLAELDEEPGDAELSSFLVEHAYTAAVAPEDVQDEELQEFRATQAPALRTLHANRTPYAAWYDETVADSHRQFEEEFSIVQANVDELNAIDALFVFLGVSTAFGMIRRASTPTSGPSGSSEDAEVRRAA